MPESFELPVQQETPGSAAGEGFSLLIRRTIHAPVEKVFEAWTCPSQLQRWWGPAAVDCPAAEVDLRTGGRYRIANRYPDGSVVWISGEFVVVAPPHLLEYTWRLEPESQEQERVTVRFESRSGLTDVSVVHRRIAARVARDGHRRGWHDCLDGLASYFNGRRSPAAARGPTSAP